MQPRKKTPYYFRKGPRDVCEKEYKTFKRCFPQLTDPNEITGDLTGKWVIWKDGWVYGMAAYETQAEARKFASLIERDEDQPVYIVVKVDLNEHQISPLQMLADAISDVEFLDFPAEDE